MSTTAVAVMTVGPTTAQRHEAERIAARYGRVELRPRPNGVCVVYVLGDQPEHAFMAHPGGGHYLRAWPSIIVGLAPEGRPVWAIRPPRPRVVARPAGLAEQADLPGRLDATALGVRVHGSVDVGADGLPSPELDAATRHR